MHCYSYRSDSISNMAATAAILKIYFRLPLQNRLSDWAKIWYGALGQPVDTRLFKSWQYDIQYGRHGSHLENWFMTSTPEPLVRLSWNLIWSIRATSRCMDVQKVVIWNPMWQPWRPFENLIKLFLQNRLSDWAEIWCGTLRQWVGSW